MDRGVCYNPEGPVNFKKYPFKYSKNKTPITMKKPFLVLFIIVIAMTGIVSAAAEEQLIGGSVGYYDITSTPAGASVTVDGNVVGITPASASVYSTTTPGHTISVEKAGYQSWSQYYDGNPASGQHIAVHASLVLIPTIAPTPLPGSQKGYYVVTSDPAGARVDFDGTDYGMSPVSISVSTTELPATPSLSRNPVTSPGASSIPATLLPTRRSGSRHP